jgi:hypothetical protein
MESDCLLHADVCEAKRKLVSMQLSVNPFYECARDSPKIERFPGPIEIERESGKRINGQSSKTSVWLPHTDVFAFGAASFHGMRLSRFGSVRDPQFPAPHHERASECDFCLSVRTVYGVAERFWA